LEKGEVFDSNLLKDTVNSLIAEGKRNFAIDLSPLDYIYSDAINVILAINRRILDVSGRLSLLSPISEVRSILERAGLHNILKIYDTETELLKSSEDIILQTTRFNLSELKSYQDPKPKNEFEDFRSQIGAAMVGESPSDAPTSFSAPAFDSEVADDAFAVQQPRQRQQAPRIEEPFVPPAPPPPPPRQAAYPFETQQAPPRRPAPAAQQPFPVEQDAFEFQAAPSEASRAKPRPAPAAQPTAAMRRPDRDFDRFESDSDDDDFDEDKPKRSPLPMIIGIAVLLIVVVGGLVGYNTFFKKSPKTSALNTLAPHGPATKSMPEIAQPVQPSVAPSNTPAASTTPTAAPAETPVATPSAPDVTEPSKAASAKEKPSSKQASASSKSGSGKSSNKISITSKPSGATVTVDGRVIGTTPCKWTEPPFGTIMLIVTKSGYLDGTKTLDYNGGNKSEFLALSKAPKESGASSYKSDRPSTDYSRPAEPAPEEPAPAPSRNDEPAPEPAPAPAPAPAPSYSGGGGGGGESATVFISSMPPVADVYMDGKLIGKTNISKLNVTAGSHSMKYVKGAIEVTEDMTFKAGDNPSHLVILKKSGM
jgi:anti-anti-sigma factor